MNTSITVWQGGQLVLATSLPQFNHTTGSQTRSIQITNDSDLDLIYKMERMAPVLLLARYRLTVPADPNCQFNISLVDGQTGTADNTQSVTLAESDQDTVRSIEPLNTNVIPIGLRYLTRFVSDPSGTQIDLDTDPTDRSVIIVMPQQAPSGGYTVDVWTYLTPGVPSTIRNTFAQSAIAGGSVLVAPIIPALNATWHITVYGLPPINDSGFIYVSPDYRPTITASPSIVSAQITTPLGQKVAASSVSVTPPSDLPVGKTGQLAKASSMPVTPPSDLPVGKTGQQTAANSMPTVPPSDLPVGKTGQQTMANSLPVVLPSDQIPLSTNVINSPAPSTAVSTAQAFSAPAAATLASITIPAVANQHIVVDEAVFRLLGRGTADIQVARITSTGVGARERRMSVPATLGSVDETKFTGYLGALDTSVVLDYTVAPATGNFEVIDVVYHYVDSNMHPV